MNGTVMIEEAELASRLGDLGLVVLDSTVTMTPQPVGASKVESAFDNWAAGHIPGSRYVHMVEDFSEPSGKIAYGLPSTERVAAMLGKLGVRDDSTVVLYGSGYHATVTRVFWVLEASGVRDVRILNGGWQAWVNAGHKVSTEQAPPAPSAPPALTPRPELVAGLEEVKAAMAEGSGIQLVNALSREQFAGTGGAHYGRPGRIPGSISVPFRDCYDAATGRYHDRDVLEDIVARAGLFRDRPAIIYCGGGIAASGVYFVLRFLGFENISLYDGSLLEWSADASLPLVCDIA